MRRREQLPACAPSLLLLERGVTEYYVYFILDFASAKPPATDHALVAQYRVNQVRSYALTCRLTSTYLCAAESAAPAMPAVDRPWQTESALRSGLGTMASISVGNAAAACGTLLDTARRNIVDVEHMVRLRYRCESRR